MAYTEHTVNAAKKQESLELEQLIKTGQWQKLEQKIQYLCGTVFIKDNLVESDFIKQIKQNKMDTFGDFSIQAIGNSYFVDIQEEKPQTKLVENACGKMVKVSYTTCRDDTEAQIPQTYTDILRENYKKRLTIALLHNELKKIVCGVGTLEELKKLITEKLTQETYRFIKSAVLCMLNDVNNYKTVKNILYCCGKCKGQSLISAINTFALNLQEQTENYNLAGRDYDLPIKDMWLLKSYNLHGKIKDIMSNSYNKEDNNLDAEFGNSWALRLTVGDGIILSKRAIQMHETLNATEWKYHFAKQMQCGTTLYFMRLALANMETAVVIRLIETECGVKEAVDNLINLISNSSKEFETNTEDEAKKMIEEYINAFKPKEPALDFKFEYSEFTAPTTSSKGVIKVKVKVYDSKGVELELINNRFNLLYKEKEAETRVLPTETKTQSNSNPIFENYENLIKNTEQLKKENEILKKELEIKKQENKVKQTETKNEQEEK